MHTLLERRDVVWKGARLAIRSPDPNYVAKREDITTLLAQARAAAGTIRRASAAIV